MLKLKITVWTTALCAVCTFTAFGQDWVQRNPLKNISTIAEMHVGEDQSIFALDVSNILKTLLISTDNGLSYRNVPNFEAKDLHMLTDDVGFMVASNKLFKTTNKFETAVQFTLNQSSFSNVFFLTEEIGFVSGGLGRIHKTIDGGQTWTAQTTGTTNTIRDVYFIDENKGFACGDSGIFLQTLDGGTTWTQSTLPTENNWPLNKILFINANQGIVVGVGGQIFRTNNGGTTWTAATSGTLMQINDIKFHNGKYVAVCNYGVVLQSTNLGVTWSNYEIDYWKHLNSVAISNTTIYIGSEGKIFQSIDNGATWTTHLFGVNLSDLNAASFADENYGLVVGKGISGSSTYTNILLRTTNGGLNWEQKGASGGCIHLRPDGKALSTGGLASYVGYSSDFGNTWTSLVGPTITQQFVAKAVWLKSPNDFFVGGGSYFESDGLYRYQTGTGWTHNPSLGNVKYINFLNDAFGLVCNASNQYYKTSDGGTTWSLINYTGGEANSVAIIDTNTFYIGLYLTTDGGATFALNQFPGYVFYYKFFTADYALALTSNGNVYKTIDTGASWQLINDNTIEDANCCNTFYISETVMVALSHQSDLFTLNVDATLNTVDRENIQNKVIVYPNPTSDKVFITATQTTLSDAILYDLNGKIIKRFTLSEHPNGLDISAFTAGIYFMHIESNSQLISVHRIIKK